MLPLAATPEFQAVFSADLTALRTRAGETLAWLQVEPENAGAHAGLGTALHGLKGLAGMTAARPLSRVITRLERVIERAARLAGDGDTASARELFAACGGPAGELDALLDATARGEGKSPGAEAASARLLDAIHARWPELSSDAAPAPVGLTADKPPKRPTPAAVETGAPASPEVTAEADVLAFLHELGVEPPAPPPPELHASLPEVTLATPRTASAPPEVSGTVGASGPAGELAGAGAVLASGGEPPDGADAVDAEMLQYFVPETAEYCDGIERTLMEVGDPAAFRDAPEEPRRALMRFWHTIKGAANSIGLDTLGRLAHAVEDVFEESSPLTWNEQRRIGIAAVEVLRDFLRECAACSPASPTPPVLPVNVLIAHARMLRLAAIERLNAPAAPVTPALAAPSRPPPRSSAPAPADSEPEQAFEATGARVDPATLDQLMDLVGELTVSRNRLMAKVQTFTAIQSELESCKNRLLRVVGGFQERHEYSSNSSNDRGGNGHGNGNGHGGGRGGPARPAGFGELEFDEYDEMNLLSRALVEIGADTGELIDQSRRFFGAFAEDSDRFRKVSVQLQEAITQVRMVPLAGLFRRLRRVAADAARKEGKEIEWVTEGGDTRLDKVIVEGVFTPLLHLVRNAVGHGVEAPDGREAAGKPRAGRLLLRATQKSGHALIELEDDGGGLDFRAIRERAVSAGLLGAAEAAGAENSQLVGLIFKPGFSTRATAQRNDVSGRGIGMDVVLQQVTRLNGTIEVESRAGAGCKLTLKLPVTLAIGQAMFVRVGGQTFALPLAFVDRLAPCPPDAIRVGADGQEELAVETAEGGSVPLLRLEDSLGLPRSGQILDFRSSAEAPSRPLAVVARLADNRVAFPIEAMLRRADIVSKGLGPLLADHPCFAGATTDLEGRVVLILDVPRLAQDFFARRGVFAFVGARVGGGEATAAALPEPEPVMPARVRPSVLIVDDSLSVRKVSEKLVTELGYEAVTATDGVDALEKLVASGRQFACVLTDLEMPRMDGFELLSELRGQRSTRDLPVIVVTSRQADKHRQRAESLGATDYLVKPFSKVQLAEKLAACHEAVESVAQAA